MTIINTYYDYYINIYVYTQSLYVYIYDWINWLYSRNWHNIVNQPFSNFKNKKINNLTRWGIQLHKLCNFSSSRLCPRDVHSFTLLLVAITRSSIFQFSASSPLPETEKAAKQRCWVGLGRVYFFEFGQTSIWIPPEKETNSYFGYLT